MAARKRGNPKVAIRYDQRLTTDKNSKRATAEMRWMRMTQRPPLTSLTNISSIRTTNGS